MKKQIFFAIFFLVIASPAYASVVLNEIAWMGTPVNEVEPKQWWRYEWLELHNSSQDSVSLNGWSVELLFDEVDFTIPLTGAIPSQGYFLIVSSDKISNYDLNYANLAGKFRNSGQLVQLKNSAGVIVDSIDAGEGWPSGDNEAKLTMARKEDGTWAESKDPGGTPKAANTFLEKNPPKKDLVEVPMDISLVAPALITAFVSLGAVFLLRRRLGHKA